MLQVHVRYLRICSDSQTVSSVSPGTTRPRGHLNPARSAPETQVSHGAPRWQCSPYQPLHRAERRHCGGISLTISPMP
ncbi:hypothetical protein XENTR_v10022956 [Xenopus tropicalis]|nr:hypothetical protein XENTR_v10022956 [Xenopus tropicalis]